MALPITGAATQGASEDIVAVANPFPVVAKSRLDDATDELNDTRLSGKKNGAFVLADNAGTMTLVMATGEGSTDTWASVFTGATYTTPV